MEIAFKPSFLRQLKKLAPALQEEALEKIELFKEAKNHSGLKVHKLHGELKEFSSFSINYRYRIVFMWEKPNTLVTLVGIGDHSIYE